MKCALILLVADGSGAAMAGSAAMFTGGHGTPV